MVLAKFSWGSPVQDSCCCCRIVVVGSLWLLMVLYVVGWFWLFPYGIGRSGPTCRLSSRVLA